MHQQPPPLPPPTAAQAAVAQRLGGPVDASEGFGGALINVDQQKQLGFGGGLPSQAAQSAPEQLMMRGQFPPVSAGQFSCCDISLLFIPQFIAILQGFQL